MRFYHIENKYIDFLRQFDPRVLYNKNEQRPYIGIIFEIEDIRYYAPLSSPKPKHIHMKNNLDFRKIDSGKLGAVNLNNMIPVPDSVLIPIHIGEITDPKYRRLLNEQYRWLLHDMINIENAARKLRQLFFINENDLPYFQKQMKARCCNFILLEQKYKEYNE